MSQTRELATVLMALLKGILLRTLLPHEAKAFYPILLEGNLLWGGTGGATLGVDPLTLTVFLCYQEKMEGMEFLHFQDLIKGFSDTAAELIFSQLETKGYAFDVEIYSRARTLNLNICKIPVTLVKQDGSKIRLSRDPLFMLWELFKIARKERGKEGKRDRR